MDNSPTPRDDATNTASGVATDAAQRWHPGRVRLLTAGVLIAVVAAFLAGVATNGLPPSDVGTPVRGGSIVDVELSDADTLLPLRPLNAWSVLVDQALWAPLWYGDDQGVLHAGIADLPSLANGGISTDLRSWTLKLHPGLKWSNGSLLTADDLAFSLTLYSTPAFANTLGFPTTAKADPIGMDSVTKVDDLTVKFVLRTPDVAILALLADGVASIVPRSVFGSVRPADIAKSPENIMPSVVSGPFMVSDRVQGDYITVVRNPYYYLGPRRPYLDRITFKILKSSAEDPTPTLTALKTHEADAGWFLDVAQLDSYRAISGYTTYLDQNPAGYEWLVFNLADPLLRDHAIRQAITMSIDLTQIMSRVLHGTGAPTCDDAAGTFAHEKSLIPCYSYDPAGAGRLLDADGWTMGADGYRHKQGQALALEYATRAIFPRTQVQPLVQADLKSVGIQVVLKTYEAADLFGSGSNGVLAGGHFQIAEFMNSVIYDPDDHTILSSTETPDNGGSNYMHYANPTVDQTETAQQQTADPLARAAAFHTIHQEVLKDLPVMYLFSLRNIACARSDLHNYRPSALGPGETWNVWDWYLARA